MPLGRRLASLLVLSLLVLSSLVLLVGCGGEPTEKEMQQAQGAIDAARTAGADRYARDEFAAAEDSLKHAHDAVSERDYRLALTRAFDSRDRAETAAKEAAENKATARAAATRALADTEAALAALRATIKPVEGGHGQPRGTGDLRAIAATTETALQKARAAMDAGDYGAVTESLAKPMAAVLEARHDAPGTVAQAPRRKR